MPAKPLTQKEIDAICNELRNRDIKYAQSLDAFQDVFLKSKPRIKNFNDFKIVEELKRVMIGLHDRSEIVIIDEADISAAEKKAAERIKKAQI